VIAIIGIYKITNKINGKIYIGKSTNISRRFSQHKVKGKESGIYVDEVIKEIGVDNFTFEVVEETSEKDLDERETYWIHFYDCKDPKGYNKTDGGEYQSRGENNGRSKLTNQDIEFIRQSYNAHKTRKETYEHFKDKICFSSFSKIWDGTNWSHIMPEVLNDKNKYYYTHKATNGELSPFARFSNEEVIELRKQYVIKTAREIYKTVKGRVKYETLQDILWGRTYKELPIYKKKEKKWINL
jgi:group I intron endonuclease